MDQIIKASEAMCGDLIDLENVPEPYVSAEDGEHCYAYQLAEVIDRTSERTGDGSMGALIEFDSTTILFPANYRLTLVGKRED